MKDGKDIAVVSLGPMGKTAEKSIGRAEKESGKCIAHYDLRFLKPLDERMLHEIGQHFEKIVTLEDGVPTPLAASTTIITLSTAVNVRNVSSAKS